MSAEKLGCRENCPFYKPWGEYPCMRANNGNVCKKLNKALTEIYQDWPVTVKGRFEGVIYMDKTQKVGTLFNGVVTPELP